MAMTDKIYPRTGDRQTIYLKNAVADPDIEIGDYTIYNDFVNDPREFQKNNVLYHYPINHDRLVIGKFCSIACGAKFLFNSANHTLSSLSTYTFPLFFEEWGLAGGTYREKHRCDSVRLYRAAGNHSPKNHGQKKTGACRMNAEACQLCQLTR